MKNVTIKGYAHPAWVADITLCVGDDRRNTVMHIASDEFKKSHCGRHGMRSIDAQPDFAYTICGECIERAVLKVQP